MGAIGHRADRHEALPQAGQQRVERIARRMRKAKHPRNEGVFARIAGDLYRRDSGGVGEKSRDKNDRAENECEMSLEKAHSGQDYWRLISVGVQPAPYEAGLEANFVFVSLRLSVARPRPFAIIARAPIASSPFPACSI